MPPNDRDTNIGPLPPPQTPLGGIRRVMRPDGPFYL
jgi:hypothetical protein